MFTDDKMELVYSETGKAVDAMKVLLESIPHGDNENYTPVGRVKARK